jgi:hypothetical protein
MEAGWQQTSEAALEAWLSDEDVLRSSTIVWRQRWLGRAILDHPLRRAL